MSFHFVLLLLGLLGLAPACSLRALHVGVHFAPQCSRIAVLTLSEQQGDRVIRGRGASRRSGGHRTGSASPRADLIPNLTDLISGTENNLAKAAWLSRLDTPLGDGQRPPRVAAQRPPRVAAMPEPPELPDSLATLCLDAPSRPRSPPAPMVVDTLSAWVLPGKPAIRDQITLELAARVSAAIHLVATEGAPDMICFCGGEADSMGGATGADQPTVPPTESLSSASLCYHTFVAACEAQQLDVSSVHFIIEGHRETRQGVLSVAIALRQRLFKAQHTGDGDDLRGTHVCDAAAPLPTLLVTLISTDHALHRLRAVEALTPRLSPVAPLRDLHASVEFVPVASPYALSTDGSVRRQAHHLRMIDELEVVLANLRGIAAHTDCLHAENSHRLEDVRSYLDKAVEGLGEGASAAAAAADDVARCEHQCVAGAAADVSRVQQCLQPLLADPVHGTITTAALQEAYLGLSTAVAALKLVDPDRPCTPDEIMQLLDGNLEAHLQVEPPSSLVSRGLSGQARG